MFDLMRVYTRSVLRSRVACLWIGPRLYQPLRLGVDGFPPSQVPQVKNF